MKEEEKIAYNYLRHLGFMDIVYEPDGNGTPDFLINGRTAVEVRRLNQNYEDASGAQGLESGIFNIRKMIRSVSLSFGPPLHGQSWFVCCEFHRPLEPSKILSCKIREALKKFKNSSVQIPMELALGKGFTLTLLPASDPRPTFFVPGAAYDDDSGGWVSSEVESNLHICIREKTIKSKRNAKTPYPEWWLILVDYIGYALDESEREEFRERISISHDWQKIILVEPSDNRRAFEI